MNSHILINWNFHYGCNFSFILFSLSLPLPSLSLSLSLLERHLICSSLVLQGCFKIHYELQNPNWRISKYIMSPENFALCAEKSTAMKQDVCFQHFYFIDHLSTNTAVYLNYNNDKMRLDRHKRVCSHDPFPVSLRPRVDRIGYR